MPKWSFLYVAPVVVVFWSAPAVAQHSDIHVEVDGGRVITEPRIAAAEFGEGLLPPYRYDDPGFHGHGLPPGAHIGFHVPTVTLDSDTRSLWFWDGMGDVAFGPMPTGYAAKISCATIPEVTIVDGVTAAAGFDFAETDAAGGLHTHLQFDLVDGGGTGIDPPSSGVYLLATTLTGTGLVASEPLYWVAACSVDEVVHEAAIAHVFGRLVVPEPSAWVLAAVAGLVMLLFGRRLRAVRA